MTVASGMMRSAVSQAVHLARHRKSGAERIADVALHTRVLADMALDVAGATALTARLAHARDKADANPAEDAFFRLIAPAAKFWIAKITPAVIAEAVECVGSTAYCEGSELARLHRDAPAVTLWAGTGNSMANEVVRIISTDPEALDAVINELGHAGGLTPDMIRNLAKACIADRGAARILTEQLAMAAAAAALKLYAPRAIEEAFVDTRLNGQWRSSYGMLDARIDCKGIVNYTYPGL
jgi:putative acyl-CoA dehydrogenase